MSGLRVVHISTWDAKGGSGRSAYRLHTGLRAAGHDSRMLVGWRHSDDPDVATVGHPKRWERRLGAWLDRCGALYQWYPSSRRLIQHPWIQTADVVQLYNVHGGYFALPQLSALARLRPVVWRLSDVWALTGHCAYPGDCTRWQSGCGACPQLGAYPAIRLDTTAWLWRQKQRVYQEAPLTVVTPTAWLAGLVARSPLLSRAAIEVIPNGVDTAVFQPRDRAAVRMRLGLPQIGHLLLFSAASVREPRKGAAVLAAALARLPAPADQPLHVVLLGAGAWAAPRDRRYVLHQARAVSRDQDLAAYYAAADVFVLPTREDNLPNSVLEAMACGTPVVSSRVGGLPEAVRDGEEGYLTPANDPAAVAAALQRLLGDPAARRRMGATARATVLARYAREQELAQFEALYRSLTPREAAAAPAEAVG